MTNARDNIRVTCSAPGTFPHVEDEAELAQRGDEQPAGREHTPTR
jgi:hypothetical protein